MIFPRTEVEKKLCQEGAAFILIAKLGERIVEARDQFPGSDVQDRVWAQNAAWEWLMRTQGYQVMVGVLVSEDPDTFSIGAAYDRRGVKGKKKSGGVKEHG